MKRLGFFVGVTLLSTLIVLNLLCSDKATFIVAITSFVIFVVFLIFIRNKKTVFVVIRTASFVIFIASSLFYLSYSLNYKSNVEFYNKTINLSGTIYEQPIKYNENSFGYIIKPTNINAKGKVLITSETELDAKIYDNVDFNIKISNSQYNDPLDQSYNRAKGIYLSGRYIDSFINYGQALKLPIRYHLMKSKEFVVNTLNQHENASIATAIMTGDKTGITDEQNVLFQKSGISHLMSTSGFHLSLLSTFLLMFLSVFKLPRKVKLILVILASILFSAFIGFPPSITRSLIMMVLFYLGLIFYIEMDTLNSLGVAATIICILNPFSALDIGFLLSFTATLGILCVPEKFNIFVNQLKFKSKLKGKLAISKILGTAVTSIYAIIFTTPLIMLCFGSLPIYSVLGNIIGLFFAPIIVIIAMLVLVTAKISVISAFVANFLTVAVNAFLYLLKLIGNLPSSMVYINYVIFYVIFIFLILFLFLKKFADFKIKTTVFSAIASSVCICGIALMVIYTIKMSADFYVKFIDVGQGDSQIISDGINLVAIDAGENKTSKIVIKEIKKSNANFKTLMISHFHVDHAGATTAIIEQAPPERIIAPTSISDISIINSIKTKCAANSVKYETAIGDVQVDDISNANINYLTKHIKELEKDENLRSAIVTAEYKGNRFLFMGDYDTNYTNLINIYGDRLKANVLKVAHHGSRDTVPINLISTIKPSYAVISVGKNNSYNLPNTETINLLKHTYKIPIYRTDEHGDITFSFKNNKMKVAS